MEPIFGCLGVPGGPAEDAGRGQLRVAGGGMGPVRGGTPGLGRSWCSPTQPRQPRQVGPLSATISGVCRAAAANPATSRTQTSEGDRGRTCEFT